MGRDRSPFHSVGARLHVKQQHRMLGAEAEVFQANAVRRQFCPSIDVANADLASRARPPGTSFAEKNDRRVSELSGYAAGTLCVPAVSMIALCGKCESRYSTKFIEKRLRESDIHTNTMGRLVEFSGGIAHGKQTEYCKEKGRDGRAVAGLLAANPERAGV